MGMFLLFECDVEVVVNFIEFGIAVHHTVIALAASLEGGGRGVAPLSAYQAMKVNWVGWR